jgi:hypothetical protein
LNYSELLDGVMAVTSHNVIGIGVGTVVEKIYQKKRIVTIVLARYMLEAGNESKQPQIPGMMLWVEMETDMGMIFW